MNEKCITKVGFHKKKKKLGKGYSPFVKCLTPKTDGQCSFQFLLQKVYLLVILFFLNIQNTRNKKHKMHSEKQYWVKFYSSSISFSCSSSQSNARKLAAIISCKNAILSYNTFHTQKKSTDILPLPHEPWQYVFLSNLGRSTNDSPGLVVVSWASPLK